MLKGVCWEKEPTGVGEDLSDSHFQDWMCDMLEAVELGVKLERLTYYEQER